MLLLANAGLRYRYRRESVAIRANVVKATHGETREEILGSGDASIPMQQFPLRNSPLTWVSAPTPSGVATTLKARVNGVLWDEIESLAGAEPTSRQFTSKTSDDAKTTLTFGNGREGSRVPSGANNVTATYRVGLGPEGNVRPEQITLIVTRPLGVKEVINPIAASGGAGPETRDQARANVPVALQALDRLVSLRDYADFARTFAGVAKASAQRLPGGRRPLVHLTIAGDGDMHIDETSDLYRNLLEALQLYGDPFLPVRIAMRDRITVMLAARVKLDPHYLWETTEPAIRALLRERFGFEQRSLGQTLFPSEVIAAIQSITGVVGVDLDDLRGITQDDALGVADGKDNDRIRTIRARLAQFDPETPKNILPAQIAYITPEVADTVVLQEAQ
jgi:predicted phage baseplate assembly protein